MNFLKVRDRYALILFTLCSCNQGQNQNNEIVEPDNKLEMNTEEVEIGDTTFLTVDWTDFKIDLSQNEVKQIEFQGYLGRLNTNLDNNVNSLSLPVYPRRNQFSGFSVDVKLEVGEGKNQIFKINSGQNNQSFGIIDSNLDSIMPGDLLSIKAIKDYSSTEVLKVTGVEVTKINKSFDENVFDLASRLTQLNINDSLQTSIYCYMTGHLTLPENVFLKNVYTLNFNQKDNALIKTLTLKVGEENSCAIELPKEYLKSDFKLIDFDGKSFPGSSKIKVYGLFERNRISGPNVPQGTFKLEEIEAL